MLEGLPDLLSVGLKGGGGTIGFINGAIQGLAKEHLPKFPEEELVKQLMYIESEIRYWRTGERDAASSELVAQSTD